MSPSQVLAALQAWDALNLPTNSSLDAHGEDGKRYPRDRHMLAWDLERAIERLSPLYRGVALDIIAGLPSWSVEADHTACQMLSEELKGQIEF